MVRTVLLDSLFKSHIWYTVNYWYYISDNISDLLIFFRKYCVGFNLFYWVRKWQKGFGLSDLVWPCVTFCKPLKPFHSILVFLESVLLNHVGPNDEHKSLLNHIAYDGLCSVDQSEDRMHMVIHLNKICTLQFVLLPNR